MSDEAACLPSICWRLSGLRVFERRGEELRVGQALVEDFNYITHPISCLMGGLICRTGLNVKGVRVLATGASKKIEGEQDGAGYDPALIWRFRKAVEAGDEFMFAGSTIVADRGGWEGGE